MYNIKPPPNRFRFRLNCLNPAIWNWFNGNVQSNFDSEIRKISKALIIFSTKTNLFLIELIFRWSIIIVFKALSVLCLQIRRMSVFIEKRDSEFSKEREPWPIVNRFCLFCNQTESKLFKKFLKFLAKADIPWSFRCKLLLFKCHLTSMLLWQIKCIFTSESRIF